MTISTSAVISVSDFTAFFDRDFSFGKSVESVRDSDIERAINTGVPLFNPGLFDDTATQKIAALYLAAHLLVIAVKAAGGLKKKGKGINSTGSLPIANKSAGPLSVGYAIPQEVIENSTEICSKLGVPFKVVKFDFIPKLKELKKDNFAKGYPCNVCTIIFHDVITKVCVDEKVNRVILGRNWWRLLDPKVKAVRTVQPPGVDFNIEFMSLPFALQMKEEDQQKYLQRVGWTRKNIYGDSTNCLIPGLVEKTVYDRIGYHPELNLLSREVITGFIKKEKAASQLSTVKDLSEQLNSILDKKDTTGK